MNEKTVEITVNTGDRRHLVRFHANVAADVNPHDIVDDICREYKALRLRKTCVIFVNRPWEPLQITFVSKRGMGIKASVFLVA